MSYLERLRRDGRDANPFFSLMGIELGGFCGGQAELFMSVRPDMLNGVGWLQGGLYTALCDEAMALALFTALEDGAAIATITESTAFLQGIRSGRISARGRVAKLGRSIAFIEGEVRSDVGEALARSQASFAILPKKA